MTTISQQCLRGNVLWYYLSTSVVCTTILESLPRRSGVMNDLPLEKLSANAGHFPLSCSRILAFLRWILRAAFASVRDANYFHSDKSCRRQSSRVRQLMLPFIPWAVLLLLLGTPGLARGASDLSRVDGQTGYGEDWHRGSKGTDVLSQLSGIHGRRYKHGEPPPGRTGDGFSGKLANEPELKGEVFSSRLERVTPEGLGVKQILQDNTIEKVGGESVGLEAPKPASRNLERLYLGSLLRDCLKVKCSPLASFNVKQPSVDENPQFISKVGSPTFQGPVSSAPQVAISPPFLEWGSQPVFAPSIASLTVVNTCNSTTLTVFQPFSTDVQFYTMGFEEKVVDPGDELAIPIVFLPTSLGVADAMLIVQTSAGGFLIQAQGRGIGSPYRVQSLQGLRVTLGETLKSTITLHNPRDEVLRVGEVYAWPCKVSEPSLSDSNAAVNGGPCEKEIASPSDVSNCADSQRRTLRLASEAQDPKGIHGGAAVIQMRPPGQLDIEPHSSNPIAEFEFAAVTAERYSGYLHIKLSGGIVASDDVLILPIDVQVGEAKGDATPLEPVVDVLEFGILTKEDQTSKVDVVLYNPGTRAVEVEDISLLLEDENIVYIEYRKGHVLLPNSETKVAVVTYMGIEETVPLGLFECHPRELLRDRVLMVRTNSSVSPLVEVPYRALVFHGSVGCDPVQGSVGFVPERSAGNGGARLFVPEGGALSEQRVHFVNGLSVPLPLFIDLQRVARTTNAQLLPPDFASYSVCCHESSPGHLAASVGQPSIAMHNELLFPLVQIGSEDLHWVNVTNPNDKPLYVHVLVSSAVEAGHWSCENNEDSRAGCSHGVSDSSDLRVICDAIDNPGSVFSLAEGAIVEVVVEPHGEAALGPVVFRPPERCLWTGLLSLWNNLTKVEWVPLQGSGGSASLIFLDGDYPVDVLQLDSNVTHGTPVSGVMEEQVAGFLEGNNAKTLCSQRVSRGFWAKNTGDLQLDVTAVEIVGGGCSAYGFEVDSCDGFSLAPGQTAELFFSFHPGLNAGVFQRDLQLITSAGIVQIPLLANFPEHVLPLCSDMAQSTNFERAFLGLSIVALVVVLGVFIRLLVQEMSLSHEQLSTNGLKSVPHHKGGGRQIAPVQFSPAQGVVTKSSNSVVVSGRALKCSSGEPEVQSRTGDGTGASGPGRPKESFRGLVRALKGVADSLTGTIGPTAAFEDSKECVAPPPGLPGPRMKIPNSAPPIAQKSNLGSPMRDASSPPSAQSRKGMTEKRSQARFDAVQAKVAPEPLEESLPAPVKQSPLPRSPKSVVTNCSLVFTKQSSDGESPRQHSEQTLTLPVSASLVTETPPLRSPRKGSQFNQFKQVGSPKSQSLSPKAQPQAGAGVNDKDKSKRKKRRSNVGIVKHESFPKGTSGSSSPSSSPASPATPASPSRPISPLFHSESQPNTTALTPSSEFSGSKDPTGAHAVIVSPLNKLDVKVERHTSSSKPDMVKAKEVSELLSYRRGGGGSLSVDVASTALREMAQAKVSDLSWSTVSGKGNRSTEKTNDAAVGKRSVAKDWATVARRATIDTAITDKREAVTDDRGWDRRARTPHSGYGSSPSPTLTPSATFPRRQDRSSDWSLTDNVEVEQELFRLVGSSPPLIPVSTMPLAARAPQAKITKPYLDDSSRDSGWGVKGEYTQKGSNGAGEMFDKNTDKLAGSMSGLSSEDQRVYDIWGNHFGEISRCSTQQIGSPTTGMTEKGLQSLAVLDATPSFFSSFPQPNFPSIDTAGSSSPLSGITSGFSVFSQAQDIETFCLPSTLLSSPKTVSSRHTVLPDRVSNNFGLGQNGFIGHGIGGISPRKPRGPYSPPLGPSPMMTNEFVPLLIPETTGDPSCLWSGSSLQDVFTNAIQSQS